jgi:small GTP-binding protein
MSTSSPIPPTPHPAVEAKLVLLGSSGVGKTSLLARYLHPDLPLSTPTATVGASFVVKRLVDDATGIPLRMQLWDTSGQERYRSIAPIFYRGAQAALLVYDVTSERSFGEMGGWLRELREKANSGGEELIVHVVGTKGDLVAEDPERREVSFERAVGWVAREIAGRGVGAGEEGMGVRFASEQLQADYSSPSSKRSSGHWLVDEGWDMVHEVNAKDGEGVDEVFRVLARKLVDQKLQRDARIRREGTQSNTPAVGGSENGDYFNGAHGSGSFRLGHGDRDKRRSWLGIPSVGLEGAMTPSFITTDPEVARTRGRCC